MTTYEDAYREAITGRFSRPYRGEEKISRTTRANRDADELDS